MFHRLFTRLFILLCLGLFLMACGHSTASFLAKGEEYLQKRKFHDALMQFRSAAESDKDSAKAHWGLARTYESLGKFNEVLDELRKTVQLDETNLDAKAKLGNYFLLVQPPMIAETEKIRDEILAANPNFIEGHILSASIMAAQGKPDGDVVAAVNKAIALDPKRIESHISLERLYMTREKGPEAEAAIKKGLAESPSSIPGITEYGRFLMYSNRDLEAEGQFQKAVAVDPSSIEAREAIAKFFVASRQMEKAERGYLDLVQVQENSPESRLELAEFYYNADRKAEGIETLNRILADAPGYVLARYRLGKIYLDQRDKAHVNEQLDALFKINDDDTEALMLRTRLRLMENRPEDAIKDLEEILKKQPSATEPLFLMSQARLSLGQIEQANAFISDLDRYHPTYIRTGLLKIQAAFTASDAQSALKFSNDLIAKAGSTMPNAENSLETLQEVRFRGLSSRGLAYLELGKFAEARTDLQETVRLSPGSAPALVNLAKVFAAERNREAALAQYEKALAADAQSFDAAGGIVKMSIELGQTAKAHAKVEQLIAANEASPDILAALHYLRSTIYQAERNPSATETELTTAISLDENYLPAYSAYASLLSSQNRTEEAVAQYQKVIEKRPGAQAFTMLGILEDSRGNTAEAEGHYRKALEISPDSSIAANNLAWLIADNQGNLDEALQLATKAVAKNPTVAGFYDTLGWVYLKKGLTLPAVEQLKKAVALDDASNRRSGEAPTSGYRMRLGIALARTGDKVAARREVEASLRNGNDLSQKEVTEAKNILASL